jgi:hypothetical protein
MVLAIRIKMEKSIYSPMTKNPSVKYSTKYTLDLKLNNLLNNAIVRAKIRYD